MLMAFENISWVLENASDAERPIVMLKNMIRKLVLRIVLCVLAQDSLAVENSSKNEKRELDPFAPAVAAYAHVCSERYPENAKYYQAAVKAIYYEHQEEYEQLNTDIQFQKELGKFREQAATKSKAQLDSECEDVQTMGKEAMHLYMPEK